MESELHNLKWEKHSWVVMTRLANLYRRDMFIDCTMYVEGEIIHAHKNLLAAVSPFFEKLFMDHPQKKSFDFDNFKHKDVKAVIDFLYYGFVKLPPRDMQSFLKAAEKFQIQIACAPTSESCGEDVEVLPPPTAVAQRRNSVEDDWNSLIGRTRVKEEPPEDSMPPVLSPERVLHRPGRSGSLARSPRAVGLASRTEISRTEWQRKSSSPFAPPAQRRVVPSNRPRGQLPQDKGRDDDVIFVSQARRSPSLSGAGKPRSPSTYVVPRASRDGSRSGTNAPNTSTPRRPPSTNPPMRSRSLNRNLASNAPEDSHRISRGKLDFFSLPSSTPKKPPFDGQNKSRTPVQSSDSIKETQKDRRVTGTESELSSISPTNKQQKGNQLSGSSSPSIKSRTPVQSSDSIKETQKDRRETGTENQLPSISPTNKQQKCNQLSSSSSPSIKGSSNSPKKDVQQIGEKRENSRSLRSPSPKKSPSKLLGTSLSPAESPRDAPARARKSKNTKSTEDSINSTDSPPAKRGRASRSAASKDPKGGERKREKAAPKKEAKKEARKEPKRRKKKERYREEECRSCEHCGKTFSYYKSYNVHLRLHGLFVCLVCERPFDAQPALDAHSAGCAYRCELCGVQLSRRFSLQEHLRLHSGERPYECAQCGKHFPTSGALYSHGRVHSADRPHHCHVCGKSFGQPASLKQHLRTHLDLRPFKCAHCPKAFNDRTTLRRHVLMHTGLKQFQCDVCKASFGTKVSLERHMYQHLEDKPFSCDQCPRKFTQLVHLKSHMISHGGEKPHSCTICGKSFSRPHHLKRHMVRHKD